MIWEFSPGASEIVGMIIESPGEFEMTSIVTEQTTAVGETLVGADPRVVMTLTVIYMWDVPFYLSYYEVVVYLVADLLWKSEKQVPKRWWVVGIKTVLVLEMGLGHTTGLPWWSKFLTKSELTRRYKADWRLFAPPQWRSGGALHLLLCSWHGLLSCLIYNNTELVKDGILRLGLDWSCKARCIQEMGTTTSFKTVVKRTKGEGSEKLHI